MTCNPDVRVRSQVPPANLWHSPPAMALRHLFQPVHPIQPQSPLPRRQRRRPTRPTRRPSGASSRRSKQVDPARRRYLAGFAYVLARAAHADMISPTTKPMRWSQIVSQIGGLPEAQAILVVEIARNQSDLYGGTEDYLVTREFKETATAEEKRAAVAACFAIAATRSRDHGRGVRRADRDRRGARPVATGAERDPRRVPRSADRDQEDARAAGGGQTAGLGRGVGGRPSGSASGRNR